MMGKPGQKYLQNIDNAYEKNRGGDEPYSPLHPDNLGTAAGGPVIGFGLLDPADLQDSRIGSIRRSAHFSIPGKCNVSESRL
jgi:hypothetical protein